MEVTVESLDSTRHRAHVQSATALPEVAALRCTVDLFFREAAGSFTRRLIAGDGRLSMHAYGAANDLNAELNGYWLWTDAAEEAVGAYARRFLAAEDFMLPAPHLEPVGNG